MKKGEKLMQFLLTKYPLSSREEDRITWMILTMT
jgi:hypothetical protein